jgi:hypothetical protein
MNVLRTRTILVHLNLLGIYHYSATCMLLKKKKINTITLPKMLKEN